MAPAESALRATCDVNSYIRNLGLIKPRKMELGLALETPGKASGSIQVGILERTAMLRTWRRGTGHQRLPGRGASWG
jgi:hypothetical protein